MSAWIVTPYHIDILVTWAAANGVAGVKGNEAHIAKVLMDENVRSVDHRYGETNENTYEFTPQPAALTMLPGGILKATSCLNYQSCETDDYESTEARAITKAIEVAALRKARSIPEAVALRLMGKDESYEALPGYKDTKWGLEDPTTTQP